MPEPKLTPPKASKKNYTINRHNVPYEDPYSWLKDPNWQKVLKEPEQLDPEIRQYLEAENAYTKSVMASSEELKNTIFEEIKGRIKEEDASVPIKDGSYEYYHRYETGQQYPIFCRRKVKSADEEVLLNVNVLAKDQSFCGVGTARHSDDHRYIAYTVDFNGSERYIVRIRDLETGKDFPDIFTDAKEDLVWHPDSKTIYFIEIDENHRAKKVRSYKLGDKNSQVFYEEKDDGFFLYLSRTHSREFITISARGHTSSEIYTLSTKDSDAAFRVVEPRRPNIKYSLAHSGNFFYILFHEHPEKDGKVFKTSIDKPGRMHWEEMIPFVPGVMIQELKTLKNYLVRLEMFEALPRIVVRDLRDQTEHSILFKEEAYDLDFRSYIEFDTTIMPFSYSSPSTPEQVFHYDVQSKERVLIKEQEIPSGHNPSDYVVHRIQCKTRDGVSVPVTILRHKNTPLQGETPLLLYGYGSYGVSRPAAFSISYLSLVNRGFIYALAHIRGGKEKGYAWYEDAKLLNKRRTFNDFVDCAKELIAQKITAKGKIIAFGGSAGGMLMGVVANEAPELFSAIIAQVPFVDVLNTMCDVDLPLTPPEWPEWGNPIEDKEAHDYIASYSPYDNVTAQRYPNILAIAGLTDPRVTYWEAAKWVARLRELKTDNNLLLLDVCMSAGHGGASGRFDKLKETAFIFAFAVRSV